MSIFDAILSGVKAGVGTRKKHPDWYYNDLADDDFPFLYSSEFLKELHDQGTKEQKKLVYQHILHHFDVPEVKEYKGYWDILKTEEEQAVHVINPMPGETFGRLDGWLED